MFLLIFLDIIQVYTVNIFKQKRVEMGQSEAEKLATE